MDGGTSIETVRTVAGLRCYVRRWRDANETVALVPTMGALHEGHLSLVRRARTLANRVCVSLFVNPAQFGPNEDYAVYPRDEAGDAAKLCALDAVDLLYAPAIDEMYPEGALTRVSVAGAGDTLEGEHRPGFFTGVATVVSKLLMQALPDVALFGEKDFQQLLVVRRMVADLWIPVRIEGVPTVREADGLALSSRNSYLTAEQRAVAPALYRVITNVAAGIAAGADPIERAAWAEGELLRAGFDAVDYVAVRDAETLAPWQSPPRPGRVLAAARIGETRLIDNVPLSVTSG